MEIAKAARFAHWDSLNVDKSWFDWTFQINCQEGSHPSVFKKFNWGHSGPVELELRLSQAISYRIKLLLLYHSLQDLTLWLDVDKDSSWESTPILRKSPGVDNIDNNQSSTTATGFYMAQQYRQGSWEWKVHIRVVLLSCNHNMQSDISFLRTREPPGPEGCLIYGEATDHEHFTYLIKL